MYKYNPLIQFIAQLIMSYGASVGWALAAPRVSYFKAAWKPCGHKCLPYIPKNKRSLRV